MVDLDRILIVGGGIAGLAVATALHLQGYTPELVERSPSWPAAGAGITMPANGLRVLRALGVAEAAIRTSAILRRWRYFDKQGKPLCVIDLEDLWRDVGPSLGIARVRLQDALLIGAAAVPKRLGVSLIGLTQDSDQVSVKFSDETSKDYDLVIGADGIYSTVRRLTLSTSPPNYAGQMLWRAHLVSRPQGIDGMMIFMGERTRFGLVPMGDGQTYGFGILYSDRFEDPLAGRLERVRSRFAEFGAPVSAFLEALQEDEQLHVAPMEWVELEEWYRGRVVLIGDAAHAGPPAMAEGGCMALEDSLVLADVLHTADNVESALETYVRRRRPRADWVQKQSRDTADSLSQPSAARNARLRESGEKMFRERFQPLIPEP